jgi:hypothetical protein
MLRCLSPSGVALDVASSADIPDQFTLFIVAEKKIHFVRRRLAKGTTHRGRVLLEAWSTITKIAKLNGLDDFHCVVLDLDLSGYATQRTTRE